MHIPDPESTDKSKSEVEITDLDSLLESDRFPGKPTRRRRIPSLRVRVWMSMALIVAIALLVVTVLVSLLHPTGAGKVIAPSSPINYPVSLSVVAGVCYVSSTTGVVTALLVSDGVVLWHHASGKAGEGSVTVVDGVIYLAPLLSPDSNISTVTIEALRTRDGSQLWSRTLPIDSPSFQLTVANNVVYIMSAIERIDALRASDGSPLWHYTSRVPFVSPPSVAGGVVYAGTRDGHLSALRASDGSPLWTYRLPNPLQPSSPVVADNMLYLSMQNGDMDVLHADTGVLLWRYTPQVPTLDLYPRPLVASGVVYALTQDNHLVALRTRDGSRVWSVALHATNIQPSLTMAGGVIYVETLDSSLVALRASSGSILWRYPGKEGIPASLTVAQGVIYLAFSATSGVNSIGSVTVLRASDGFVLWRYSPHVPAIQSIPLLPVVGDDLVLIALQDGSINALRPSSGTLRWHRVMNS